MSRGTSKLRGMALVVALAVVATGPAGAQGAELKNDGWAVGEQSNCQMGFLAGESAAAAFAPPSGPPIRIQSVEVLGCNVAQTVTIQVYDDSLTSASPDGSPLYSGTPVSLSPGLQNFDLSDQNIVTSAAGVRVSVTGVSGGVPIAADADGITANRNMVFSEGAWNYSEFYAIPNDFVIRANYTSLNPPVITKSPKKVVRTSKRKAVVSFKFESSDPEAEFQCRLDEGDFKPCSSPQLYKARIGRHTFDVALVVDGEPGPTASYGFRVKRK